MLLRVDCCRQLMFQPGGVACEVLGRQSDLKVQTPCSSGSSMPQTPKAPKPLILGPGSWRAVARSSYEPVQVLAPTSIRPRRMGRAGAQELRYKAPNESSLTGDLAVDGSAQAARLLLLEPLSC